MDQRIIQNFKTDYRKLLIKHASTTTFAAQSADNAVVTGLVAVYWIHSTRKSVKEATIRDIFRSVRFARAVSTTAEEHSISMQESDSLVEHVSIGGRKMNGSEFVQMDSAVPS